ncbi:MAG TPA: 4Fe-4S binding protein [Phycisphaerales bacterium]|nr:4Fe-4S binding protein [Phycisphaerales bacterium]
MGWSLVVTPNMRPSDNHSGQKSGDLALPVLEGNERRMRGKPHSRMGRRRAIVLALVQLLIVIHIVQWVITGSTLSPVEPSEAMQTLELGSINAGFVFFVLAILATFIFGRFFCGWGCHVIMLQDLCTWIMTKLGVRPKPFRSRLLVWAPLVFGLYMFVWPMFKRWVLFPAMDAMNLARPIWLRGVSEVHGFSNDLVVTDFWASFPPWYVAVPFLIVIGFAAVYFLGSKGFCTYGCPYGGIFGVVDAISPGKIVVNDDCEHCGYCTAVCTSNVRVHEEVRDFGKVVDPGCMKCLDCVSACPNDALRFRFATPAALTKPINNEAKARQRKLKHNPKRFDLSKREEIVMAALFVGYFFAFRGMLNVVPMLMAAGMAGEGVFVTWKFWSIVCKPNVRLQNLRLKTHGKLKPAGVLFVGFAMLTMTSAIWSGWVVNSRWRAHIAHETIDIPIGVVLRDSYVPTPNAHELAERGIRLLTRSDAWSRGGRGWSLRPQDLRELAFLYLVDGSSKKAADTLRTIFERGHPTEELVHQLGRVMQAAGAPPEEVLETYEWALQHQPDLDSIRSAIAYLKLSQGATAEQASELWNERLAADDLSPEVILNGAEFFRTIGNTRRASSLLETLDIEGIESLESKLAAAELLARSGSIDRARSVANAIDPALIRTAAQARSLATIWMGLGELDSAYAVLESALADDPESVGLHEAAMRLALMQSDFQAAERHARSAVESAGTQPWALDALGESIVKLGLQTRQQSLIDIGLESLASAQRLRPKSATIAHDLGQALLATGKLKQGLNWLTTAARLAPDNEAIARAYDSTRNRLRSLGVDIGPN